MLNCRIDPNLLQDQQIFHVQKAQTHHLCQSAKRRCQNVHFDAKKRDKSFSESVTDTSSIQKE